jgi:hypothetical protein
MPSPTIFWAHLPDCRYYLVSIRSDLISVTDYNQKPQ